jgi:hypothetical protein
MLQRTLGLLESIELHEHRTQVDPVRRLRWAALEAPPEHIMRLLVFPLAHQHD